MRVLVVGLATFEEMAGGSARYLSGIVAALGAAGNEVDVVTAMGAVGARGYLEQGAIGQLDRTLRRLLFVHPRSIASILRHRPDVINVHFAFDGLGAVVMGRLLSIPIIVNFQGPWAREAASTGLRGGWPLSTRLRRFIERRVYRSATVCIVLSNAFRDLLVEEYGVARDRVRVIPAGIDRRPFELLRDRKDARRLLGLRDAFTIVTVRRLVPRMGLDLLLEAIARLPADRDVQVVVAGSGPEREALEARTAALGIADQVSFVGRIPETDLTAFYAAGDLCVVPTRDLEGFGYVALEAYAAGTPVVATAVGGLRDLVGGFDPEDLVPPESDPLAARIIASMDGRLASREACRAYAATFDWSEIAPRVEAIFRDARGT